MLSGNLRSVMSRTFRVRGTWVLYKLHQALYREFWQSTRVLPLLGKYFLTTRHVVLPPTRTHCLNSLLKAWERGYSAPKVPKVKSHVATHVMVTMSHKGNKAVTVLISSFNYGVVCCFRALIESTTVDTHSHPIFCRLRSY